MKKFASVYVALAVSIVVLNSRAVASPTSVTFTGGAPSTVKSEKSVFLKASATFTISNSEYLVIDLSNISTNAAKVDGDILTAMFFDIAPTLANPLVTSSATVAPGNDIFGPMYFGNDTIVSGQWAYRGDLGGRGSQNAPEPYGISSTSFKKYFNLGDLFNDHQILNGTKPLNGVGFGLLDTVAVSPNAASDVQKADFIQNTIQLVLNDLPVNFSLTDISDVSFEFGTSFKSGSGTTIPGVLVGSIPEPSTIMLVAAGMLGVFTLIRSRARSR